MNEERVAALRAPFPDDIVGKLPRVTCPRCSDRKQQCTEHKKAKCSVCGAYVSTAHLHIDYVGHAAVTDRLLQCDPDWSWEPMGLDEFGLPVIRYVNDTAELWVRLTVYGKTMLGVGTESAGKQDLPKVLIGDALRNAAMRFGVALDLWSKQDLHVVDAQIEEQQLDARQALFDALRVRVEALSQPQTTLWEAAKAGFAADWWKTDDGLGHAEFTLHGIESPDVPSERPAAPVTARKAPPVPVQREPAQTTTDTTAEPQHDLAYYRKRINAQAREVWGHLTEEERTKERYDLAMRITGDSERFSLNDMSPAELAEMVTELAGLAAKITTGVTA